MLGLICGLGIITKATFLPLLAAVAIVIVAKDVRLMSAKDRGGLLRPAVFGVAVLALGAWWYILAWIDTGTLIGSNDETFLARQGGLISGLSANFSLWPFLRGLATSVSSFAWSSTWSFAQPGLLLKIPLLILLAALAAGCASHARAFVPSSTDYLSVLTLALFIGSLFYFMLVYIAAGIGNNVPTWYLHSLAPIFSLLVGRGLARALTVPRLQPAVIALVLYSPFFLVIAVGTNLLYYTGCGETGADTHYMVLPPGSACATDLARLWTNLSILGYPSVGFVLFGVGLITMTVGMTVALRRCTAALLMAR